MAFEKAVVLHTMRAKGDRELLRSLMWRVAGVVLSFLEHPMFCILRINAVSSENFCANRNAEES